MSFDLSRIRFDARRDFLGVVMQQGRVQLDSDWNEWVAQLTRRMHAGTLDTFGASVVPRVTPDGFHIEAAAGALSIGPGRIYVNGVMAENHGDSPDVWNPQLAELTGTSPLDFHSQPYYPNALALPEAGPHLVYIDVWQRDVTAIQAPDLVEQAVGVDSTGRHQTVWQVNVLANVGDIDCSTPDDEITGWLNTIAPSAARLSTGTAELAGETDPCRVPPDAGYLGLENQLYRVEVHTGGSLGTATFKWSRDNATVASRVTHINPARDRITVESIGRDDVLRFNNGDWVEVTDDWLELHNLPGELRRISVGAGVDDGARTLSFDISLSVGLFPTDAQQATDAERNTRVRRWDQTGQVRREDGTPVQDLNEIGSNGEIDIPAAGTRLFLEHGIVVEFDLDADIVSQGGEFNSGDHWVFAARSVDASIEVLDNAPPLGIHHHYARLAVVNFPDNETDCRTLWPPVADGQDCACTVCVTAEGHNNGTATLQHAIDSIKDSGGTVCLGIGTYTIEQPIDITDARSLRVKGQGRDSLLQGNQPNAIINIADTRGIVLENFTAIGSLSSNMAGIINVRNTVDFRAEQIDVIGLAVENGTSVGIGLSGRVQRATISECAVVAERGVAAIDNGNSGYLLTAELRILRNLLICSHRAVNLDGISLHYGATLIKDNLMLMSNEVAVAATGGGLPGSTMTIADNRIFTEGDGIHAGVDTLTIERNEITHQGSNGGDGIVVLEGIDAVAMNNARICANRLQAINGNAIAIRHRIENAIVCENIIEEIGLAALVMSENAAAGYLDFSHNQCRHLGVSISNINDAFCAIQLVRVERGDIRDNVIASVARQAVATPAIDAVRALAVGQLRIAGNRFFGIGPDRLSADISAVQVLPPFDRLAIDDNSIDRIADDTQEPILMQWRAINVWPDQTGNIRYLADARFFHAGDVAYLLTATHVVAISRQLLLASIRGNQLRGHAIGTALTRCGFVDDCLFAENQCEIVGEFGSEPLHGLINATTINASNNRLIASDDHDTLHLHPQSQTAIVMGNISTGNIRVQNGTAVPDPSIVTNIIGF
jgi:Family of unknown function (DUF6519)